MINTQLERIVQLVMDAYVDVHGDEYDITPIFELEVRKALMQQYCSSPAQPQYSYTIAPGTLTGTWGSTSITNPATTNLGVSAAPIKTQLNG